jgi:hypothetical protein
MPPRPESPKTFRSAAVSFKIGRAIERPEVAAWIGQCVTCWAQVEAQASRLFTLLSGLNAEAGVALYNSFTGASLKENSIKVLARSGLARKDYELIDALLRVVRSHQNTRDKIAHWYWLFSDQIPDGLVLIDPKGILTRDARLLDLRRAISRGRRRIPIDALRFPKDRMYVYRVKDLKADADVFVRLAQLVNRCHGLCRLKGKALAQRRAELSRDGLLAPQLARSPTAGR